MSKPYQTSLLHFSLLAEDKKLSSTGLDLSNYALVILRPWSISLDFFAKPTEAVRL
jgi:hypothetical protein